MDSEWQDAYVNVYKASSLQIPWYVILGNHDYHLNPEAQIDYYTKKRDNRWIMPKHCYTESWKLSDSSSDTLEIIFIDTAILAPSRVSQTAAGGSHEVTPRQMDDRFNELEEMLRKSVARWLIVAGHYTGNSLRTL
jgi:tartrate-resistant acid phosphatase type 5